MAIRPAPKNDWIIEMIAVLQCLDQAKEFKVRIGMEVGEHDGQNDFAFDLSCDDPAIAKQAQELMA